MNQSHDSLRDDYEVTGKELDTLVEEARKVEGTIGSRMTGAGFGGCTVSIVEEELVETFIREVGKGYYDRTGLKADFYVAEIGDGSKQLN
jgi:galactokinase